MSQRQGFQHSADLPAVGQKERALYSLVSHAKAKMLLRKDPLTRVMEAACYYCNRAGIVAVLIHSHSVFCLEQGFVYHGCSLYSIAAYDARLIDTPHGHALASRNLVSGLSKRLYVQ